MLNLTDIGLSYKQDIEERYYQTFKKALDLTNPMTFSEKIQWLKIFGNTSLKVKYADKVALRDIVEQRVGRDFCLPFLAVYEKEDIESIVPKPGTILKCNHGSRMNIRIEDNTDSNSVIERLKQFADFDYSTKCFEPWYHFIKPRVVEEVFISNTGEIKTWCFNGQVLFFQAYKILKNGYRKSSYYDSDWSFMEWLRPVRFCNIYDANIPRPKFLEEIKTVSSILSKDFAFARVDFIYTERNMYVGEVTFAPAAGFRRYKGDADKRLGDLLSLEEVSEHKIYDPNI